jgi:hypothetical protein
MPIECPSKLAAPIDDLGAIRTSPRKHQSIDSMVSEITIERAGVEDNIFPQLPTLAAMRPRVGTADLHRFLSARLCRKLGTQQHRA